jgi:hypothetical protein
MAVSWRGLAGIPVGVCHDSVPRAIAQTSRHAIPEVQNPAEAERQAARLPPFADADPAHVSRQHKTGAHIANPGEWAMYGACPSKGNCRAVDAEGTVRSR